MNSIRVRTIIHLAFQNIRLNWRHSVATCLAIAAGFTAVSLFSGFMKDMRFLIADSHIKRGMTGHVIIEKTNAKEKNIEDPWTYSISKEAQAFAMDYLAHDPRVLATAKFLSFTGMVSNGQTNAVYWGMAYELDQGLKIRGEQWAWNTLYGKPLHLYTTPVTLLGTGLAKRLNCDLSTPPQLHADGSIPPVERPFRCASGSVQLSVTTEHTQVNATQLQIGGMVDMQLRDVNDRLLIIPLPEAQRLLDTERVSRIAVELRNDSDSRAFIRDFHSYTATHHQELEATYWLDHPIAAMAKGGIEILDVFRMLFLSVVAVIAAMSVANTIMKSINERIREIGTLRSIGFRRGDIVLLFSAEGFFIGFFSCAAGLIITIALGFIISHLGLSFKAGVLSSAFPIRIAFAFGTWFTSALTLSLITFAVSWLVSRRAAHLTIAETMRHVA